MRVLVFNSKGGCAKSLISREIIAGPKAKDFVIVEIDPLNQTQKPYTNYFKDVMEIDGDSVEELLIHLNEYENIVVDVGSDYLAKTLNKLILYDLFDDIDKIVIPLMQGRTDGENALKTHRAISEVTDESKIIFALSKASPLESIEDQFEIFFQNAKKLIGEFDYISIMDSDIFISAQKDKKLVASIASDSNDYKLKALSEKEKGDMKRFRNLMKKELFKRSAKILMDNTIIPAHQKIAA